VCWRVGYQVVTRKSRHGGIVGVDLQDIARLAGCRMASSSWLRHRSSAAGSRGTGHAQAIDEGKARNYHTGQARCCAGAQSHTGARTPGARAQAYQRQVRDGAHAANIP
jgi:hypothetical protein